MKRFSQESVLSKDNGNGHMAMPKLVIANGQLLVESLAIANPIIVDYLDAKPEAERADDLVRAAEVGVFCLERVTATVNVDFMRQQIEQQVRVVTAHVEKLPDSFRETIVKLVGTNDGQVLAPIVAVVNGTEKVLKDRIALVQKLLDGQIDPSRKDSTLGKALAAISLLLDPKHEDSIQSVLEKAVDGVSKEDGPLVSVMRDLLEKQLKPMQEELIRLGKEVRGQEAVAAALAETTAKGDAFEEELLPAVLCWAKFAGASVDHVGGDKDSGDIVVTVSDPSLSLDHFTVVIEARDEATPRGKKQISDDMAKGLAKRSGHFGLYVSKTGTGLAKEIGDWSEGCCAHGPYVACTANNLLNALRWAMVSTRIQALLAHRPEADVSAIQAEVNRIRTALRHGKTAKTKISEIHKLADGAFVEVDSLQQEITEALLTIERALRAAPSAAA